MTESNRDHVNSLAVFKSKQHKNAPFDKFMNYFSDSFSHFVVGRLIEWPNNRRTTNKKKTLHVLPKIHARMPLNLDIKRQQSRNVTYPKSQNDAIRIYTQKKRWKNVPSFLPCHTAAHTPKRKKKRMKTSYDIVHVVWPRVRMYAVQKTENMY